MSAPTSPTRARRAAARTATSLLVLAATAALSCAPAIAADGGTGSVDVTNTETVQIYTDATGKVSTSRVYEQLSLSGTGSVDLENPTSKSGVRNLDGFGGADAEDGEQRVRTTVDGEKQLRTVADFEGKAPLTLSVAYELDGKAVEPGDVVGESGRLQVTYTVKNVSAVEQEVSFDDGRGGTITKTVQVPIPMVGSLTTVAPSTFTNVTSGQANMAGDGKGGTKMSFTMTLIPPIGSDTATFGYTADIVDGVVPRADMSVLPVDPLQSPSFKTAATSYEGGAQTGVELTGGAVEIDSNLLKLRDGAGDLLAGLVQLRDGADELSAGLTDTALPGARKLADGAGDLSTGLVDTAAPGARKLAGGMDELRDGLVQTAAPGARKLAAGSKDLDAGLGKLDDGASKLSAGAEKAADGSTTLATGAKDLSNGVKTLDGKLPALDGGAAKVAAGQQGLVDGLAKLSAGVSQLPASVREQLKTNVDYQTLLGALTGVVAGIGTPSDATDKTVLGGLNLLKGGLDQVTTNLTGAINGPESADGTVAKLQKTIRDIKQASDCGPVCAATVDGTAAGVGTAQRASLTTLRDGIVDQVTGPAGAVAKLKFALSNGSPASCDRTRTGAVGDDCGISQVLQIVQGGIPVLVDAITTNISQTLNASIGAPTAGCDPTATLRCAAGALNQGSKDLAAGIGAVIGGVDQLDAGGTKLAAGANDLAAGLGTLSEGSKTLAQGAGDASDGAGKIAQGNADLADGLGDASDGSQQLATGADDLADGLGTAADGAQKIAQGNADLADGLGDAADGSTQIADGLDQATDGAPALVDGAQRLSDEGTQKLVGAGESTAQNYGEMYAVLAAGAERANTEDMAFGAPEGAQGLTAYSYVIQGEDGDGDRNLVRGLAGLALLGAGAGVVGLRRRLA